MPTTTVHLPSKLLRALDALAARTKASRNRLVIEACERLVHSNRGTWPPGFLEGAHLSAKDRKDLAAAGIALERSIKRARRSRRGDPLSDRALGHAAHHRPGDLFVAPPVAAEIQFGITRLHAGSRRAQLLRSQRRRSDLLELSPMTGLGFPP